MNMRFDPDSKIAMAQMKITVTDLMNAVDKLEHVCRKIFDTMEPLWDGDERSVKRALAVLHQHIRELNQ